MNMKKIFVLLGIMIMFLMVSCSTTHKGGPERIAKIDDSGKIVKPDKSDSSDVKPDKNSDENTTPNKSDSDENNEDADDETPSYRVPENFNFVFEVINSSITNPDNDRRCYFKVFIDKIEMGRTTTGLESQNKRYETRLTQNRHFIKIEKWILDEAKGEYRKLNNIEQPKPNFVYFNTTDDKILKIKLNMGNYGKTNYEVGYILE